MSQDGSNGYDAVADDFMRLRSSSGLATVRAWATALPRGGSIIDVGAGSGEPLTAALVDDGFDVCAVEASPKMVAAFQRRLPTVEIACEPAECSRFFERTFDGAIAIGLLFLLPEDRQRSLLRKIAGALKPRGSLLFSAPRQACSWIDRLTGRESASLGAEEYRRLLAGSGLRVTREHLDEGESYYYEAWKEPARPAA